MKHTLIALAIAVTASLSACRSVPTKQCTAPDGKAVVQACHEKADHCCGAKCKKAKKGAKAAAQCPFTGAKAQ